MRTIKQRQSDTAAVFIEYVLAVGLLSVAMVGVLNTFASEAKVVGARFQAEMGAGEFPCDPMDPFC